jgi:hypothetical protein
MADNRLISYLKSQGLTVLPDLRGWTHRFEIKSQSSNRLYTVAQRETTGEWGCSCPGYIIQKRDKITGLLKPRTCKHLTAIRPALAEYNG